VMRTLSIIACLDQEFNSVACTGVPYDSGRAGDPRKCNADLGKVMFSSVWVVLVSLTQLCGQAEMTMEILWMEHASLFAVMLPVVTLG